MFLRSSLGQNGVVLLPEVPCPSSSGIGGDASKKRMNIYVIVCSQHNIFEGGDGGLEAATVISRQVNSNNRFDVLQAPEGECCVRIYLLDMTTSTLAVRPAVQSSPRSDVATGSVYFKEVKFFLTPERMSPS